MARQSLKLISDPEKILDEVVRYRQLHRQVKLLTEEQSTLATFLKEGYFMDHEQFAYNGELLLTCKIREENRFDGKRFKEDHPELDKEYRIISKVKVLKVI